MGKRGEEKSELSFRSEDFNYKVVLISRLNMENFRGTFTSLSTSLGLLDNDTYCGHIDATMRDTLFRMKTVHDSVCRILLSW